MLKPILRACTMFTCLWVGALASAGVRTIPVTQLLRDPAADPQYYDFHADAVAIDGDSIIVVTTTETLRSALLYRRDSAGTWAFERYLMQVPRPASDVGADVAMKNYIAVIKLDQVATIWEKQSGNWVRAATTAEIRHPGKYVISVDRVLAGADGCSADGVIYQKSATDGRWGVTGRIDAPSAACKADPRDVELNYDNALVRTGNVLRGYRRNGASPVWPGSFSLNLTGEAATATGRPAMQKTTVVMPGSAYYRQSGGTWGYAGQVVPMNYANGSGHAYSVLFRDNVLLTTELVEGYRATLQPYVYLQNAAGGFDHVGVLNASGGDGRIDISGNTIVTGYTEYFGNGVVSVLTLPTPLRAPRVIVNDFETRDTSGIQQTSFSAFAPANDDGRNWVLRQYGRNRGFGVWRDSYWTSAQSISARIVNGGATGANHWVGMALRYLGANSTYLAYINGDNVARIVARQGESEITLAEQQLAAFPVGNEIRFSIVGDQLEFRPAPDRILRATDSRFPVGRAGLVTEQAVVDFDDVVVSPTAGFNLLSKSYDGEDASRPLTEQGGTWLQPTEAGLLRQSNTTQQALAFTGIPTNDQVVSARMRVDQFGSTDPVAWAGLVARYVDARTFYYLSVRSSNQLQIRKTVNGVTTVLAAKPFTPPAGEFRNYRFLVIGDELRAYVDDALIATTRDAEIAAGKYGVGTYRAAASFASINVDEP